MGLKSSDKISHIFEACVFGNGYDFITGFGQSFGRFFNSDLIDVFSSGFSDIFFKVSAKILRVQIDQSGQFFQTDGGRIVFIDVAQYFFSDF